MNELVVAACNGENTDWTKDVPKDEWVVYVYDKIQRPLGREAYIYLIAINNSSPYINGDMVLCQANPFDHDPDFLEHLKDPNVRSYGRVYQCDPMGAPEANKPTLLHSWCDVLNLPVQESYRFVGGAQYRLTREQISSRPGYFYQSLMSLTMIDGNMAPYCLERLWPIIWNIPL